MSLLNDTGFGISVLLLLSLVFALDAGRAARNAPRDRRNDWFGGGQVCLALAGVLILATALNPTAGAVLGGLSCFACGRRSRRPPDARGPGRFAN